MAMETIKKLEVKGMVCPRCIAVLLEELSNIGLEITSIKLGEVYYKSKHSDSNENEIAAVIRKFGFELLNDKKADLVQSIKSLIKKGLDNQSETKSIIKFSDYLSTELQKDYNYLSAIFSEAEGITLEKHIISQRIIKIQQLLILTDKSLTQISDELGYSSVSHLSRQLKLYSGFDVQYFKNIRKNTLNNTYTAIATQ